MKRVLSVFISTVLLFVCCIGTTSAASKIEPYASLTISYSFAEIYNNGNGTIDVDCSVRSNKMADEIGVESIEIFRLDGSRVKIVYGSTANGLINHNSSTYGKSYVVSLSPGSYYAKVTVFASVGSITDSKTITTSALKIS